ncbi:hypothetical protein [Pseudomonas sp. Pseusp16]|uniref:hypothetical protein n=1 Tax=Pseudomonas sp. Pseusp16 TaxID=3243021 RepID=UPI0039B5199B
MQVNGMNGWQRLWVLVSFILGIATMILGYSNMETENGLTTGYKVDLAMRQMEIENIRDKETGHKPANIYEDSRHTIGEVEDIIKKVGERYQKDIEELPAKQLKHVLTYLGAWLGICIGMYIVGLMLNWVYRGFRPKKA